MRLRSCATVGTPVPALGSHADVLTSTSFTQDTVVLVPVSRQALLPPTQRRLPSQAELRKRSSLVSIVPPGCCATGGTAVFAIVRSNSAAATAAGGRPVSATTPI